MRPQCFLALLIAVLGLLPAPAASAAVHRLAFTSFRDGNAEVYRVESTGAGLTNLTNHPANDSHPVWSPDGASLLFVSDRDGQWGLYQIDADGNHLHRLATSALEIAAPMYSPDGQWISYLTLKDERIRYKESEAIQLMLMSSDGGKAMVLAEDIHHPAWTPDSQRLYARQSRNGRLVAIDVGDGQRTLVGQCIVGGFAISPDGMRIAFDYGGEFSDIEVIDLTGGDETAERAYAVGTGGTDVDVRWSSDGKQIAFTARLSPSAYHIYLAAADGNDTPRLLVRDAPFRNLSPVWSPDSAQIAFLAAPGDENVTIDTTPFDIYVVGADGSNLTNLSAHPAHDTEPVWRSTTGGSQ